ncbi:hypothetical protein HK102_012785 [Quaeritorhiza haematococci]|nr:hypothetical protein HK102_012785 [Quaeritorhiza haematococci]
MSFSQPEVPNRGESSRQTQKDGTHTKGMVKEERLHSPDTVFEARGLASVKTKKKPVARGGRRKKADVSDDEYFLPIKTTPGSSKRQSQRTRAKKAPTPSKDLDEADSSWDREPYRSEESSPSPSRHRERTPHSSSGVHLQRQPAIDLRNSQPQTAHNGGAPSSAIDFDGVSPLKAPSTPSRNGENGPYVLPSASSSKQTRQPRIDDILPRSPRKVGTEIQPERIQKIENLLKELQERDERSQRTIQQLQTKVDLLTAQQEANQQHFATVQTDVRNTFAEQLSNAEDKQRNFEQRLGALEGMRGENKKGLLDVGDRMNTVSAEHNNLKQDFNNLQDLHGRLLQTISNEIKEFREHQPQREESQLVDVQKELAGLSSAHEQLERRLAETSKQNLHIMDEKLTGSSAHLTLKLQQKIDDKIKETMVRVDEKICEKITLSSLQCQQCYESVQRDVARINEHLLTLDKKRIKTKERFRKMNIEYEELSRTLEYAKTKLDEFALFTQMQEQLRRHWDETFAKLEGGLEDLREAVGELRTSRQEQHGSPDVFSRDEQPDSTTLLSQSAGRKRKYEELDSPYSALDNIIQEVEKMRSFLNESVGQGSSSDRDDVLESTSVPLPDVTADTRTSSTSSVLANEEPMPSEVVSEQHQGHHKEGGKEEVFGQGPESQDGEVRGDGETVIDTDSDESDDTAKRELVGMPVMKRPCWLGIFR